MSEWVGGWVGGLDVPFDFAAKALEEVSEVVEALHLHVQVAFLLL